MLGAFGIGYGYEEPDRKGADQGPGEMMCSVSSPLPERTHHRRPLFLTWVPQCQLFLLRPWGEESALLSEGRAPIG